jgi:hypothetical protein
MTNGSLTSLITGLPRSGTTLAVSMLDQQPDCIALSEPLPLGTMPTDQNLFADSVVAHANDIRQRVIRDGIVRSKTVNGRNTGNYVLERDRGEGLRSSAASLTEIHIDKPITSEFRLFIKHPAAFSAVVGPLTARLPLFACVRSPLAVLASWQTVDMPINRGRIPAAERLSPELARQLDGIPDVLSRQVYLMRWFLEAYLALPPERILRFESVLHDPQVAMAGICPGNQWSPVQAETIDLAERYPSVDIERLRRALRPLDDLVRYYYQEGLPY